MKKWIVKIAAIGTFLGVIIFPNLNIPALKSDDNSLKLRISNIQNSQTDDKKTLALDQEYHALIEKLQADLTQQIGQVNISKEDIMRGFYYSTEKKYGTPDTWIFLEAGKDSKWISPHVIEK